MKLSNTIDGYNALIKAAADSAGLAYVDADNYYNIIRTQGLTDGKFKLTNSLVTGGFFSLDGVHPTARGYALLTNILMKTLDAKFGSNFEASGNLLDIGDYPTNFSHAMQ